jgi:hypothetical protein
MSYINKLKGKVMNDVKNDQVAAELVPQGTPVQEEIRQGQEVFYTQSQEQVGDESEVAA